ncbi:DUF1501 domain-containing protein [Roseibacillus ishigakijimensis]|uniref:DUF1501 domain-containing protein n=1 Tax=Roseibacillus ishigakijimensis TaxID=454146 RepID=A0A934RNL3_9BACT|nr:DUF1501 domain-containing protein [Roseibacillus ishigakijimensis]MBK1832691.1 DUF1501 domain-containing protein [Roseibacillus ishigakijimensis]
MKPVKTRRQFLGEASCATIGCVSTLSSILNLKLANQAAAASLGAGNDCKTLVCLLLAGGCDSYNLLVRRDDGYQAYAQSRSNMALGHNAGGADALLPLNQISGNDGHLYGLHPSCPELAEMFNGTGAFSSHGRRLAFVANLGTLIQPTTLRDYREGSVPLPKSLFSHIDQINQWQTSLPQGAAELTGWAGRMADLLHSQYNSGATSMSISLAGNNVFQIGKATQQFAITPEGALLPSGNQPSLQSTSGRKNRALESLLSATYNNLLQDSFASHMETSFEAQQAFKGVYDAIDISGIPEEVINPLTASGIGRNLLAAAKTIKAREALGLRRNTIFVQRGGWDHHGELLNTQAGMLAELSPALAAYQLALEHLGVAENVISYTASDFGRTLRSNGRGTDHAWGGNQLVWGAPVQAGKVHGHFPDLTLGGADDIGLGGRMLPSTSIDQFFGEMATWFGVSSADMPAVLPNLPNFADGGPLGFLA